METLPPATVVSSRDLSADDNTWKCQTLDELTDEARIFYWATKLFRFVLP